MSWVREVVLENAAVRLEPVEARHLPDLERHARDPEIWRYMASANLGAPGALGPWLEGARREHTAGTALTFAITLHGTGEAVGTTSYLDISERDRRLEIGRTWLGRAHWRSAVNTAAKALLLEHAFETLGCHRVQLKTDSRNERSQAAIARLGAVREGVLRAHMVLPDGFVRDTVMYSVVRREWPAVRARLEALAGRAARR